MLSRTRNTLRRDGAAVQPESAAETDNRADLMLRRTPDTDTPVRTFDDADRGRTFLPIRDKTQAQRPTVPIHLGQPHTETAESAAPILR